MTLRLSPSLRRAAFAASMSLLLLLTACNDAPQSAAVPPAAPVTETSDARSQGHDDGMEMERESHERGMETARDAHPDAATPPAPQPGGSTPMDHDMPMPANAPAADPTPMNDPAKAPAPADPKVDPPMKDMDHM